MEEWEFGWADVDDGGCHGADPVPSTGTFFVLWNPESDLPVRRVFLTKADAVEVAEAMARRHDTKFYVLRAVSVSAPAEKPVTTEALK